ncbi:hypothetical protein ACFYM2_01585 [Streptomyces sp. NPDC006711]|uniref:hypothetical protein n=1 Tax=Streptomyces sp. NPDC006711 TaxID=3364762 RepID=UPI00368B5D05
MPEFRSAEERLERVRETLRGFQGERARSRAARRRGLSRGQNLLLGAALHAASRFEQGLEPTGLEAMLLDVLRAGAADDREIASWGRVFAEQRTARGGVAVFPAEVNRLEDKTGYDFAQLRDDLAALTAEIVAQPNVEIVDVTGTEPEGPRDSEEFLRALAEYGAGVTVLTASRGTEAADAADVARVPAASAMPLRVKLAPSRFVCERRSDELGKDEIYWAMAAGTDTEAKNSAKTPEFGSVVTGSDRAFTGDHALTLVDGTVRAYVSLNIECWEADHSSGGFYNKMREVLRTLSDRLAEASKEQNYSPPDREFNAEGWAALLSVLGELINALLGWLTNEDDLVCERSIGLSHAALTRYFTPAGRDESWMFDGGRGGRHKLWLRGAVEPVPVRPHYRRTAGTNWETGEGAFDDKRTVGTAPVGVFFTYDTQPSVFCTDAATQYLYWAPHTNTPGTTFHGVATHVPPGAAVHDGTLHCVHIGRDDRVWWNSRTATGGWTFPVHVSAWDSALTPALASHNGTLYCAYVGGDGRIHVSLLTGTIWSGATTITGWQTPRPVALTSHAGRLYLAHTGMDGAVWLASSTDGVTWAGLAGVGTATTIEAPALASHAGKLHVAYRDASGTLHIAVQNGTAWSTTQVQTGGYGAPSLTARADRLYALFI